jgi:hypothetical protein
MMTKKWNDHKNRNLESVSAKNIIFYHPPHAYPPRTRVGPTPKHPHLASPPALCANPRTRRHAASPSARPPPLPLRRRPGHLPRVPRAGSPMNRRATPPTPRPRLRYQHRPTAPLPSSNTSSPSPLAWNPPSTPMALTPSTAPPNVPAMPSTTPSPVLSGTLSGVKDVGWGGRARPRHRQLLELQRRMKECGLRRRQKGAFALEVEGRSASQTGSEREWHGQSNLRGISSESSRSATAGHVGHYGRA